MFANSLLDSAWSSRSHRGWTTIASFAIQGLFIGMLLLLPLINTQVLPQLKLLAPLLTPPASPPGPPPVQSRSRSNAIVSASNMLGEHMLIPNEIPHAIAHIDEAVAPPSFSSVTGVGIPWGTAGSNPMLNSIASEHPAAIPVPPPTRAPRVSRIMEGNLVHKVQPEYPPTARAAGIHGTVILRAIIGKDGSITNLRLVSGHPMLVKAAIDAVSRWRYRPYCLNGEPVEVETQVTVNFVLAGG